MSFESVSIIKTPYYFEQINELLGDLEQWSFEEYLAANPRAGDVIPKSGGLRKLRWTAESRSKGKRGGIRVIYYWQDSKGAIYLLTAYAKNKQEDLSAKQLKALRDFVEVIKDE